MEPQKNKSGAFHYLARTEVKTNTLNPVWEELHIDVEKLFPSELPEKRREVILRLVDFGFANLDGILMVLVPYLKA